MLQLVQEGCRVESNIAIARLAQRGFDQHQEVAGVEVPALRLLLLHLACVCFQQHLAVAIGAFGRASQTVET